MGARGKSDVERWSERCKQIAQDFEKAKAMTTPQAGTGLSEEDRRFVESWRQSVAQGPFIISDRKIVERFCAIIDRLSSGEWRTMDSAPKDGTWILVAYDCRAYGNRTGHAVSAYTVRWVDDEDGPGWFYLTESWHIVKGVTHWMPLPAPPQEPVK